MRLLLVGHGKMGRMVEALAGEGPLELTLVRGTEERTVTVTP